MRILDNFDKYGKKIFPELPDNFPNELLDEDWAQRIHSQSLDTLNSRGGLGITELLMNLKKIKFNDYIKTFGYNHKTTQVHVNELMTFLKSNP